MRRGQSWEQEERTALRGLGGRPTTAGKWLPEPRPSRSPCRPLTGATREVGAAFHPGGQSMEVCEEEESGQGRCSRASSGWQLERDRKAGCAVGATGGRNRRWGGLSTLPCPPRSPSSHSPTPSLGHVRWYPGHSPNPTHTPETAPRLPAEDLSEPHSPRGSRGYKKAARGRNGGTMSRPGGRAESDR